MNTRPWTIYLSGEIHSDWREVIAREIAAAELPVRLTGPVTDHATSDDCGVRILGPESESYWHDRRGAGVNAIRTRVHLEEADVVVVRFGEKYRQWNAAFEAGWAVARGTPLVTLHDDSLDHALKEVDAAACATCRDPSQVAAILKYVMTGSA